MRDESQLLTIFAAPLDSLVLRSATTPIGKSACPASDPTSFGNHCGGRLDALLSQLVLISGTTESQLVYMDYLEAKARRELAYTLSRDLSTYANRSSATNYINNAKAALGE